MNNDTFNRLYNPDHKCAATYCDPDGITCIAMITSVDDNHITLSNGYRVDLHHVQHVRDTQRFD